MIHLLSQLLQQIGLLLVVTISVYGFGSTALAVLSLPYANALERWLFAQAVGFGIVSIIMLGLGGLGLYDPAVAWALIVLGLVLAIKWVRVALVWPPPRPHWSLLVNPIVCAGLALVVLLPLGYALLANAMTPPVTYDVVAYHFAIPKIYIQAHRIVYIPYIVYSNWPLGTEMLYTLGLLLGSEFLPQLLTWSFAVLIAIGLVVFAHERSLPGVGLLAAALFFSSPMMTLIAGTGLVEVPLSCYTFLAFYAFWRWREEQTPNNWFFASALMSGFAASTKLNGAGTAIVLANIIMIFEFLARRPLHGTKLLMTYGLVAFLVVLPWYLKSWIFTGDPLWPFLQSVLGPHDWDAVGTEYLLGYIRSINMAPTLQNWLIGLWYVATDNGKFGSFLMGPYLVVLMPLAILPALFAPRLRSLLGALALLSGALYFIWFLLTHQTRFLMPAMPSMALLAAVGIAWTWQWRLPLGRWVLQAALLLWLVPGTWILNPQRQSDWTLRWFYLRGFLSRDAYLARVYEDYPVFQYANKTLPPDARIVLAPQDVRGYYLDLPYIWANPISQRFLRLEQFSDAAALDDALRRLGITHVWLNTQYIIPSFRYADHDKRLVAELVHTHGRLVFERGHSKLYELH